jgi:hypothetical protein
MTPPPASSFADADAARQALRMALPMLERCAQDRAVVGSGFLYVVVMDPAIGPHDGVGFDAAVLLEHAVGDRTQWDADYAAFARAKAALAWRSGADGRALQALRPHALRAGDSLLPGAVCLDGIVVACSGAFDWYDEAFALAVAANLRAIARARQAAAREANRLVA